MSSVKKNFIYNTLYQLLVIIIPLITTPYLSRILGAEKTGVYSYSYTIATYFVLFIMLGLNNYGNRTISIIRDDKTKVSQEFWSIYFMQLVFGLFGVIAYVLYTIIFSNTLITWILLLYVVSALIDINWFFFGMEQFKITVTRNTVIKIISTVMIFTFVKKTNDVYIYTLISAAGTFISQVVLWVYLKKFVYYVKVGFNDIKKHIIPNLILFVPVIAISLYKYMDKIMLGKLSTMKEVGYYEYSEKVIQVPMALINSLGTVMLPKMSYLISHKDSKNIKKYIYNSSVFVFFISSISCFGLMGIADTFVPIFLGKNYSTCIQLFRILLPSCIFLGFANVIRTQYLIPNKMDKIYICSVFMGAIVNFLINFILIKDIGAQGAAIGTLVAEAVVCIYQVYMVKDDLDISNIIKAGTTFLISGIIMYIFLIYVRLNLIPIFNLIVEIIIGGLVYIAVSVLQYFLFRKSLTETNILKLVKLLFEKKK